MPKRAIDALLQEPEQSKRREEFCRFVGTNADRFIPVFDKLLLDRRRLLQTGQRPLFRKLDPVWPALCSGPVWFFYRKMWGIAWFFVLCLLVLAVVPLFRFVSFGLVILLAGLGKRIYVDYVLRVLDALHAHGNVSGEVLKRVGGTSPKAAWISGTILASCLLLYSVLLLRHASSGHLSW